ncbi:hypothetical protein ACFLQ0_03805 [Nitrospinota bacterium]
MPELSYVGKSVPRVDAPEKVTGRAVYILDLQLLRMLTGKLKASEVPHAKIKNIDTSRAEKLPGVRIVLSAEFWTGYYESALGEDELLTEVDPLPPGFGTAYTRFTTRSKEDKPCISISAVMATEGDGKTCREARLGLGGVEAVFRRLTAAEEALKGKELTRKAIDEVLSKTLDDLEPLSDIRVSDDYRRR